MPVKINNIESDNTDNKVAPVIEQIEEAPITMPSQEETPVGNFERETLETMLNGAVQITDPEAPLVILFGPTSCGKTMTLIRLTKYLHNVLGYTIVPDESFRPSYDEEYKKDCEKFQQTVNDPIAAAGTSGYMLVDIMCQGKILCKILEAPGEYYFDPKNPKKQYPHYMTKIMMAPNRKVWCAFVEPNWKEPNIRANYVDRITALKPQMKSTDKIIFVFNKIDETPFVISPGVVNENLAIERIKNFYPGIFTPFKNTIPLVKLVRPYDCSFVPFQTGIFTDDVDKYNNRIKLYAEGPEAYPKRLWNEIKKSL
ncbi:MAG: hypothetical protein HUK05_00095 [Prevotella sp.]|nr:hypothetical protein [Prevotella sp.]